MENEINLCNSSDAKMSQLHLVTKSNFRPISNQEKFAFKILKFTPDFNFEEILHKIAKLNPKIYKNLFIFIIGHENFELFNNRGVGKRARLDVEVLKNILNNFSSSRRFLLQITTINESKFYYRRENSNQFFDIDCEEFLEKIDVGLLSLLLNSNPLDIKKEICNKFFQIFYKPKILVKKYEIANSSAAINPKIRSKFEFNLQQNDTNSYKLSDYNCKQKIKFEENQISQEQMLNNAKNRKFVVFSSRADSDKNWMLKSLKNKLIEFYPDYFMVFTQLKQFIEKIKEQNAEFEFVEFINEKILNLKSNLESEIIKKLYKDGKICILFDGFDEVPFDCSELVTKFFQSFQQNGGNQLWIAVGVNFMSFWRNKLQLDVAYELNGLTRKTKAELVESCWNLLLDLTKNNKAIEFHKQFWKVIREHFSTLDILEMTEMFEKLEDVWTAAMKYDSSEILELTMKEIVEVFVEASRNFNFREIEKFEVMTTKLLNIAGCFKNVKLHESLLKVLHIIFEVQEKHKFLNIQKISNFVHQIVQVNIPILIEFMLKKIKENFTNSQFMEILKTKSQNGRNLLQMAAHGCDNVESQKVLWKIYQESYKFDKQFVDILKEVDEFGQNVFHVAAALTSAEIFSFMFEEIEKITKMQQIKEILSKLCNKKRNLWQIAAKCNKSIKLQRFLWTTLRKYFNKNEILEIIKHTDKFGYNVLQNAVRYNTKEVVEFTWSRIKYEFSINGLSPSIYPMSTNETILQTLMKAQDAEKLKFFCKELKKIFKNQDFCNYFKQKFKENETCLTLASKCHKIELHEAFWEMLLKIFKNREELKNLMIQNGNFLENLIESNNAAIIEVTYKKFKKNFTKNQLTEILNFKSYLKIAAIKSRNLKTHKILWKIFRNFCKTDKIFLNYLKKVDENQNNIFHLTAAFSTSKIFDFVVRRLRRYASSNEIRRILSKSGQIGQTLLHLAVEQNKSLELQECLWKILRFYLNYNKVLEMIKKIDKNGNNLLNLTLHLNSKEIIEITLKNIKELLTKSDPLGFFNYLKNINNNSTSILQNLIQEENFNNFPIFLETLQNLLTVRQFKDLIYQRIKPRNEIILFNLTNCTKVEFLVTFWQTLPNFFENLDEFKKFVLQKNKFFDNFLHFSIFKSKPELTKLAINEFKGIFNNDQFKEILNSKGYKGMNLLQRAASATNDIKIHQVLWKILQDFYNSNEEFLNFLYEVDNLGNNIFHIVVNFSTIEIFEFMIQKLEEIASVDKIKVLLNLKGNSNQNLLQTAAKQNKSVEFHEHLWTTIEKFFNKSEIIDIIQHIDDFGDNLFFIAVNLNIYEVVECTWNYVEKHLQNHEVIKQYLMMKTLDGRALFDAALQNNLNPYVIEICSILMEKFVIRDLPKYGINYDFDF